MRQVLLILACLTASTLARAEETPASAPAAAAAPEAASPEATGALAPTPAVTNDPAAGKMPEETKAEEQKADEKKADPAATVPTQEAPVVEVPKAADVAPIAVPENTTPAETAPPQEPIIPSETPAERVTTTDAAPSAVTGDDAKAAEEKAKRQAAALGLHYGIGMTLFVNLQTDADLSGGYLGFSPNVSYGLNKMVTFSGSLSPAFNFKTSGETGIPDGNRRFDNNPGFSNLRADFRDLFVEEVTGLHLNGAVSYAIPLSYNNIVLPNPTIGDLGVSISLSRPIGEFVVKLSGLAKAFGYLQAQPKYDCAAEPSRCDRGAYTGHWNPRDLFSTAISGAYSHGPWSGSLSLGISHSETMGPEDTYEPNNIGNTGNDHYGFSFFASGAYAIDDHFDVNLGLFNGGPQLTDRQSFNNFVFDPKFAGAFVGIDWSN